MNENIQKAFENAKTNYFPIILLPGDGGSRAYSTNLRTKKTNLVWFSLEYMFLPQYLKREFLLLYNSSSGRTRDAKGFRVIFPGWGDTQNIENLNNWRYSQTAYFQDLVSKLLKNPFYVRNKTLRAAPYDFRKAPYENEHFMNNFPKLVQETFEISGNKKVVIVAHSLGCLYALHSLKKMDEIWKRTYIRSFVATAAPIGGSIKALLLEISGSSFGIPRDPLSFRDVERSFSSTAYLLPRPGRFPPSQIIVQTKNKNYTVYDYYRLFRDLGFETGYQMYQSTNALFDANEALKGIPDIHCVHGINVSTPKLLKYPFLFPNIYPHIEFGDGDGSVNVNSLRACTSWKRVRYLQMANVNHRNILSNPQYISYIENISKKSFV